MNFFRSLPLNLGAPILYLFDKIIIILWFSGVQILIFLAGIQKIDKALYEAAQIDGGASSWVIFLENYFTSNKAFNTSKYYLYNS